MNSPCLYCTRVRVPENCENKSCKDWQAWFLDRWETMRESVRAQVRNAPISETGIPLGGSRYAPPHRIHSYLRENPCERCLYSGGLCQQPCQAKQVWLDRQSGETL